MTLIVILQKKCKFIFDSEEERMERLATELVGYTDLEVLSIPIEGKSAERDTLSTAIQVGREIHNLSVLLA